jgi:hypothetical protein
MLELCVGAERMDGRVCKDLHCDCVVAGVCVLLSRTSGLGWVDAFNKAPR